MSLKIYDVIYTDDPLNMLTVSINFLNTTITQIVVLLPLGFQSSGPALARNFTVDEAPTKSGKSRLQDENPLPTSCTKNARQVHSACTDDKTSQP